MPTSAQIKVAEGLLASGASQQAIAASFTPSSADDVAVSLNPMPPLNQQISGLTATQDVMNLFVPGNSWTAVGASGSVFDLSSAEAIWGSASQLQAIFTYLNENHITLAVDGLMLPMGPGTIGNGVEGFNAGPKPTEAEFARLASLGANIQYVTMDEPLYYGSDYSGKNAAGYSVSEVAQLVAANAAAIKAVFPNVQFMDTEPVPGTTGIMQFAQDFQQDTGQPLAAFTADVQWGQQWQAPLEDLAQSLQAAGINFDVITDGDPATTSTGWVQLAIERMAAVESDPLLQVNELAASTWSNYPTDALPDNNPGTLTYLELVDANIGPLFRDGTLSPLVNDAPLISAPDDVSAVLGSATSIPGITVSLDGSTPTGANVAVMLTDATGLLYVTDTAGVTGNGTTNLTLSGSTGQVNNALSTLLYVGRTPGQDLVNVTTLDGAGAPAQQAISMQVGDTLSPVTVSALQPAPLMTFINAINAGTVLQGTGTPDVFNLSGDSNTLTQISLFDPRQDIIELPASMIPNIATLMDDTTATSGGALITLDPSHSVLVVGMDPQGFQAANFAFH
jgi:hypothetical protein